MTDAKRLYYYLTGVFNTGHVFDFETIEQQNRICQMLYDFLAENSKGLTWNFEGASTVIAGAVDNYSPPKVSSFLSIDPTNLIDDITVSIPIGESETVKLTFEQIRIHFFLFNCGLLQCVVKVPEEYWKNLEVLSRIRFFLQRHRNPEFETDIEELFSPAIKRVTAEFERAVEVVKPPLLSTPFLDFVDVGEQLGTSILWTHATLVAIMKEEYDPESQHYQKTLLDTSSGGIQNFAVRSNIFAFVESGDSLICVPDKTDDRGRTPDEIAYEDWVYWLSISQYIWKTAYDLDNGLYVILNLVTSHLKHKRTKMYRDVYAVNALVNSITLLLDTYKPRNMTGTYYCMAFLEKINENWRTDEMIEASYEKMNSLRELIGQLDEIETSRREHRIEMFLTFLGVFALGSLVLDIIGALSFGPLIPDMTILLLAFGIPIIFLVIAYQLLK
ncbi:MAG: hypothetical protein ACFFE2_09875 [Candidatus Thorarchaeota archaeon]